MTTDTANDIRSLTRDARRLLCDLIMDEQISVQKSNLDMLDVIEELSGLDLVNRWQDDAGNDLINLGPQL
jgi:hypothetical protein